MVIEQRFYCCEQGHYWTENSFAYPFWLRYLSVFSHVYIIARVQKVTTVAKHWHRVDGQHVSFVALPYYVGLWGFIKTLPKLINTLIKQRKYTRHVIYRVPGVLSLLHQFFAKNKQQKYAAEVVGDPADTFAENASESFLRPLIRTAFIKMLRQQCRAASAISYVTEISLQKRYPPAKKAFHTHYSSIQLTQDDYCQRQSYSISSQTLNIICIGNLAQPYKGCDFMLHTLAKLKAKNFNFSLTWIGGGGLLEAMQKLAVTLNIAEQVNFMGNVSHREDISLALDKADVFVLCSRQEGLPRVLIESMARSLVCVATNVGGVPELLSADFIIERDNEAQLLAQLIKLYGLNESELLAIASQNYNKALEYEDNVLSARRQQMYSALLNAQ